MKKIALIALVVVAMASCSQQENTESNNNLIENTENRKIIG